MTEISNEMWDKAIQHLEWIISFYSGINDIVFQVDCSIAKDLYCRYKDGDRSTELYNAIMELS